MCEIKRRWYVTLSEILKLMRPSFFICENTYIIGFLRMEYQWLYNIFIVRLRVTIQYAIMIL